MPVTLQAVNKRIWRWKRACSRSTSRRCSSAATQYISTTLDVTTAAMGNTPTNEINRSNDVSNGAIDALLDACGLPR